MIKISSKEIVDILPYGDGKAILVEKVPLKMTAQLNSSYKASYSVINFENKTKDVLTKNAYLLKKFGASYSAISEKIPNFVQCDSAVFADRRVLVVYPNGEAGIFNREGELIWNGIFNYHEKTVFGLAVEGDYFWSICPSENCVIRYYNETILVDLRIGAVDSPTFANPTHISECNGDIYVCCGGNKVRKISRADYTVSDYLTFDEQILKYYKFGKYSIAVLTSGAYIVEE